MTTDDRPKPFSRETGEALASAVIFAMRMGVLHDGCGSSIGVYRYLGVKGYEEAVRWHDRWMAKQRSRLVTRNHEK